MFGSFANNFLQQEIHQEFTCEHTPEQNGNIERVWGTIGAMARCLLKTAGLPESFWLPESLTEQHSIDKPVPSLCSWHNTVRGVFRQDIRCVPFSSFWV